MYQTNNSFENKILQVVLDPSGLSNSRFHGALKAIQNSLEERTSTGCNIQHTAARKSLRIVFINDTDNAHSQEGCAGLENFLKSKLVEQ